MTRTNLPSDEMPADEAEAGEALSWMRHSDAQARVMSAVRNKIRRRRSRRVAVVSTGVLAALSVGMFWLNSSRTDSPATRSTTVVVTAPSREVLPDGSTVELKKDARIAIEFKPSRRRVHLLRGEAHFQVAKDAARQFVVTAGRVEVEAVGTAFSVQFATATIDVLVTEGRVAVAAPSAEPTGRRPETKHDGAAATPLFIDAGNRVTVDVGAASTVTPVTEADIEAQLAWRVPQLEFAHTPLPEVVEIMNRYATGAGHVRFVIDPDSRELHDVKLNGFLRADNAAGLVYMLETHSGIRAEWRGDAEVILRKAR